VDLSADCATVRFMNRSLHSHKKSLLVVVLALGLSACSKKEDASTTVETKTAADTAAKSAQDTTAAAGGDKAEQAADTKSDTVEVSKEGTKFDPPVKAAQIPEGAWMCDMGTVHYARMDKGDGKCALCSMDLVQKGADGQGTDGHDHGE